MYKKEIEDLKKVSKYYFKNVKIKKVTLKLTIKVVKLAKE